MHSELFGAIRLALSHIDFSEFGAALHLAQRFENFEVMDCPYPDQGLLSSNVAFRLSNTVDHDGTIVPGRVADFLAQSAEVRGIFSSRIGGDGYLNCAPRPDALVRYLGVMTAEPVATVCTHRSVLLPHAPIRRGPSDRVLGFGSKRIGLLMPKREEAQRFRQIIRERGAASLDDAWMFLGMLADPELDGSAYLRGLAGSENIPWYLDRFESDARRALELSPVQALGESELSIVFAEASLDLMVDKTTQRAVRWMLSSPEIYLRAVNAGHAEQLFAHVLAGIRLFYVQFNRPENRVPSSDLRGPVVPLVAYTKVLLPVVSELRRQLEKCCELLRSVLIAE